MAVIPEHLTRCIFVKPLELKLKWSTFFIHCGGLQRLNYKECFIVPKLCCVPHSYNHNIRLCIALTALAAYLRKAWKRQQRNYIPSKRTDKDFLTLFFPHAAPHRQKTNKCGFHRISKCWKKLDHQHSEVKEGLQCCTPRWRNEGKINVSY